LLQGAAICCKVLHNLAMSKSKNVRVSVPVSPEVKAAFERLAAAQGSSVAAAMSEWLEDTVDAANSMADLLEKARQQPRLVAQQLHGYALGLGDLTVGLLDSIRAGSAAMSVAPDVPDFMQKRGLTPPVSNTGGKLSKQPKNTGGKRG
jgi:hypothetical protein